MVRPVILSGEAVSAHPRVLPDGPVTTHRFVLCDVEVNVAFSDSELDRHVLALWSRLFAFSSGDVKAASGTYSSIFLEIVGGGKSAPPPAHAPYFTSPVLSVWRTDTGFHLFSGDSSIILDTRSGRATAHIVDTFWASPLPHQRELFLISMLMMLQPLGVHGLHSVGVVKSGVGVLVVGDSGAGKTTTSLSLIRSGWSYLSDDAIALKLTRKEEVTAMAFRRGFSCTRDGWDALSTNTPADRDGYELDRDKWLIEMSEYAPGQEAYRCIPNLIVFPVISNRPSSTIRVIDDADGLLRLMPQSAGITVNRDSARDQMSMLGVLARQVRFCELHAGRDVFDDPGHVSELLLETARRGQ